VKRQVRDKWVAALRSGAYRQGRGLLRSSTDEYCCLGVLCELAVADGIIDSPKVQARGGSAYLYGQQREIGFLPNEVIEWAGLTNGNPIIGSLSATNWNDNRNAPFLEIARLVEENL
jgi:hypothetical protein